MRARDVTLNESIIGLSGQLLDRIEAACPEDVDIRAFVMRLLKTSFSAAGSTEPAVSRPLTEKGDATAIALPGGELVEATGRFTELTGCAVGTGPGILSLFPSVPSEKIIAMLNEYAFSDEPIFIGMFKPVGGRALYLDPILYGPECRMAYKLTAV